MALKHFKPTTPGRRQLILVDRSDLWKGKPVKKLTEGLSQKGGRNSDGRITMRHRGGGHKRRYRKIDFKRRKYDVPATVERLEYDPNRSAFIALVRYEDGEQSYILAPQRVSPGDRVVSGEIPRLMSFVPSISSRQSPGSASTPSMRASPSGVRSAPTPRLSTASPGTSSSRRGG